MQESQQALSHAGAALARFDSMAAAFYGAFPPAAGTRA